MNKRDYYEILGWSKNATDEEIKRALEKSVKQIVTEVKYYELK